MPDIHNDRVLATMKSLWTSELYSDMIIICGQKEYKVHRAIICPRSTFFTAAFKGQFKVSIYWEDHGSKADGEQEATTATITLDDDDPSTVDRMLLYLYTLDYPDADVQDIPAKDVAMDNSLPPDPQNKTSTATGEEMDSGTVSELGESATLDDPRMMNNVLVYAIAEKYDIPELKDLAKRKFETLVNSKWPHEDLDTVTEAIFSTTPDGDMGLRQVVIDICAQHFQEILKDEASKAAFLEYKGITTGVLDAAVKKIEQDRVLLDETFAKRVALEDELSNAKEEVEESHDREATWKGRLDYMMASANNVDGCRHCHEKFNWLLERSGGVSYPNMLLRCTLCRTKQSL